MRNRRLSGLAQRPRQGFRSGVGHRKAIAEQAMATKVKAGRAGGAPRKARSGHIILRMHLVSRVALRRIDGEMSEVEELPEAMIHGT